MAKRFLLEISVQTVEAARAAERGGADRIELCAELSVGGLTPGDDLLRGAREAVRIPIFSMIRPRAGNFVYSDDEFAAMRASIRLAKQLQMDGVVLGILTPDNRVDVRRTQGLVEFARGMETTFHRAFDECADLQASLEDVIRTGAARILTSGGAKTAREGASQLRSLVNAATDRLIVVPGAGISAANIAEIAQLTGAREFHSGLSTVLPYSSRDHARFEAEVVSLAHNLTNITTS